MLEEKGFGGQIVRTGLLVSLIAASAACAGGGGSGGTSTPAPSPFTGSPPPPPPPSPTAPASSFETSEYFFGAGTSSPKVSALSLIGASTAYATGATGAGVTVAVIDTDIHPTVTAAGEELAGKITSQSIDLCTGRQCGSVRATTDADAGGHASFVSTIIAGEKNSQGSHGVAFGASILSIRADRPGSCQDTSANGGCKFDDATLARGIDYAIEQGAKIINLSIGGDIDNDPTLENAIRRAAQAGVLVVISSGNDAEPATAADIAKGASPLEPAYIAGEAASLGRVVAVGSIDMNRKIATFSNRAGATRNFFILAPGASVRNAAGDIVNGVSAGGPDDNIVTPNQAACVGAATTGCNDADVRGDFYYVSGSSFSAPFVSGSLALMLQRFPNLAPEKALEILLTTADDYVDATPDPIRNEAAGVGVDSVSGVGILNLARAFTPIGASTASFDGVKTPLGQVLAPASGATGDWVEASGVLSGAIIQDAYDRGFRLDHVALTQARAPFFNLSEKARYATAASHGVNYGAGSFSWSAPPKALYDPRMPWAEAPEPTFAATYALFGAQVSAGRGGGGPANFAPAMSLISDPSDPMALGSQANWAMVERKEGPLLWDARFASGDTRSVTGVGLTVGPGSSPVRLGYISLRDDRTALGGPLQSRFGLDDGARLSAVSLETSRFIGAWRLTAAAEAGRAAFRNAAASEVKTSAWSLSAMHDFQSGTLRLSAAQPRRAEAGDIRLDVPVAILRDGSVLSESRVASLSPSGRELDLEAAWSTRFDKETTFEVAAALSHQPNHVQSADDAATAWMSLRRAW